MGTFFNLRLDRNITVKRLPDVMQHAKVLRLVVFETDPESGAKCVRDIFEGPVKYIFKQFNQNRTLFIEQSFITCKIEHGSFDTGA